MAGHSKWSKIKRQKSITDAKKGKTFQILVRNIMLAAKNGGGSLEHNAALRFAVTKAKESSLPAENIKKAIDKATGNIVGAKYEELVYEARGSSNLALLIYVLTDNKNRSVAQLRTVLNKNNGSLCENGSVAWMFHTRGIFVFARSDLDETLIEFALNNLDLVEDIVEQEQNIQLFCLDSNYNALLEYFEQNKQFHLLESTLSKIVKDALVLDEAESEKAYDLLEKLKTIEDVSEIYSNLNYII